jgi:protein phosphatase 1 regulatory subunit 10
MINKAPAAKVPTATKVGVPKPTTTIARATVTTIARPTTSSVTSFGGVNVRGVAAYRKDPTAGKLSSAGSGSKSTSGGVGSVLKSREPEKKKEFFTKSNYAKKKSSKLQKLQSAGKQARVGIGWKADAELEAVKFFFKDDFIVADKSADPAEERRRAAQERRDAARQKEKEEEEDVEPEDEDERAAIAKARERQQKEKAAEQRAANLTRVRRLNEMKATGRWVQPRRIEYPPGWDIHPGRDSGERGRLQSRWKGEFEVKYRSPDQIPESPREAPHGKFILISCMGN